MCKTIKLILAVVSFLLALLNPAFLGLYFVWSAIIAFCNTGDCKKSVCPCPTVPCNDCPLDRVWSYEPVRTGYVKTSSTIEVAEDPTTPISVG